MKMNEKRSGLTSVRAWWLAIPGGVALLALIVGVAISSSMLNSRNLINVLRSCGPTLLIGAAVTIPFARGHLDLSVLGAASFAGMASALIARSAYLPAAAMILIAICIGAAIGTINGLIAMIFRRKNVLFTAVATACIGAFYRYLSMLICEGYPVQLSGSLHVSPTAALMFLLPVVLLAGIFALLSFTGGGKRAFNGIYEKDEERSTNTIVPFLFSGILASFAGALLTIRIYAAQPTAFSFNPSYVLMLALVGIMIPNVKKSKGGAFLGFAAIIPAALAVAILQNTFNLAGLNTYAHSIVLAVIAVVFIILNAVIGTKASKIEYVPAPKAASVPGSSANIGAADAYAATGKNKVTAILLAIFLGPIGVHRYYLGYGKQGGWQTFGFVCMIAGFFVEGPALYRNTLGLLVLALILLLIGLGTSIWAFVDFIRIITGGLKPACDYVPAAESRPTYVSEPVPTITPVKEAPVFTPAEPAPTFTPVKEAPVFTPAKPEPVAAPAEKTKPSASSQFGALAELANLYENGMITEEVYLKRKNEILSNL